MSEPHGSPTTPSSGPNNAGSDTSGVPESSPPVASGASTSPQPMPWAAPPQLGTDSAYQAVGQVAAPLLAGFSVTLIGVIAQAPDMLRWPGATLLTLIIAVGLLLGCVQAAFTARQKYWTRKDLLDWYVGEPPDPLSSVFKEMHKRDIEAWRRWLGRARAAYNTGLTVLLIGVALLLAPPRTSPAHPVSATEADRAPGSAVESAALRSQSARRGRTWLWDRVADYRRRRRNHLAVAYRQPEPEPDA